MSETPTWPNFFIVGVAKAGTTSLHAWLKQHPQVYMSPVKEPHYFSRDLVITPRFVVAELNEYLALFKNASGFPAIGEACPSYFPFGSVVAKRIKKIVPHARIIIILRDPIERCYSHYLGRVRWGRESKSFHEALVNSPYSRIYIQRYADPVQGYLSVFGQHAVLVLTFEDLKENPCGLLKKVARFLGIEEEPMTKVDLSVENPGGVPRGRVGRAILTMRHKVPIASVPLPKRVKEIIRRGLLGPKPPIDPRAVEYLRPIFEKDLKELEELLGRRLPELRRVW